VNRVRLSPSKRADLFLEQDGICHICEGKIGVGEAWDVEHPDPLAMTGIDDAMNRKLAHRKCHKTKTADDLANIAKAKRRQRRHIGVKKPRSIRAWRKFNGTAVFADRER
jgi:5-methylcytosine-specific restriction protein A